MFVKKCGAKARTNGYQPCRQPSMANGRCRLHGGKSSGPKTEGGKQRLKQTHVKHAFYSFEEMNERKIIMRMLKGNKTRLKEHQD